MVVSRRTFLKSLVATGALLGVRPAWLQASESDGFTEIIAAPSEQKLFGEASPVSQLWTYNGFAPGPEIRVQRNQRTRIRFTNKLDEPTSIHWHGIRIANAMDGVAGLTQTAVEPGQSFVYDFTLPDAGTYWYHAHNRSWNQVARGLYGPLIVEEEEPPFDLEHDLTLVLDDWQLDQSGALAIDTLGSLMEWSHGGRLGNWITANGRSLPIFDLNSGEAYRLRLINAANARVIEIDPARLNAKILGYDGQALREPIELPYSPLLIGPAQRVDLLVMPNPEQNLLLHEISRSEPLAIAGFRISGNAEAELPPITLPQNNLPEPNLENATTVKLLMTGGAMGGGGEIVYKGKTLQGNDFRRTGQMWAFNGVANLDEKPLFAVKAGQSVVVETINSTAWIHAMHVHGHHFRIIERSESTIDEGMPWRDTFLVGPEQTTKIAFVADNPGKWLLHCHMLEHAAAGMNTWFEVT